MDTIDLSGAADTVAVGGAAYTTDAGGAAVCETTAVVRYQETDQMGVAHHSVYPIWFEVARTELVKMCGMTYGDLERAGVMMPLIDLRCNYCGFSRYEDEIAISARIESLTGARVLFSYEARRVGSEERRECGGGRGCGGDRAPGEPGVVVARGSTEHAFTDRALKPYNLKKRAPDVYAALARLAGRELAKS